MPEFKGQSPERVLPSAEEVQGGMDRGQGQGQELTQEQSRLKGRAEDYKIILMDMTHRKEVRDEVIKILKSSPDPLITVPTAAMTVNDNARRALKQSGVEVKEDVQIIASQFLISDLIELGTASGAFEKPDEGDIKAIVEDTYSQYVERGLKDRSIDPIQLQLEAEKFMDQDQLTAGLTMGQGNVPQQPSRHAMADHMVNSKVKAELDNYKATEAKKQAMKKQSALGAVATSQREV